MSTCLEIKELTQAISVYPTGSRYTCTPPVMDTDEDYLVLVKDANESFLDLLDKGWEDCMPSGSEDFKDAYEDEKQFGVFFHALRFGEVNIMVTSDPHWYMASCAATEYVRNKNIQDKEQRIRIFRNLKYGEPLLPQDLP